MHQVNLCVTWVLQPFFLVNPLFSTTNLLLKANNLRLTIMRVSMLVDERLVVTHRRPSERHRLYGQALMDLMEWGDDNESEQVANFSEHKLRRVARRHALARFLTWEPDRLEHYCPYGCCRNLQESRQKLTGLIEEVFFAHMPGVPALNRWTKMHPPIAWWACAFAVGQLIPQAFGFIPPNSFCLGGPVELTEDDIAGAGDDATFQRKEAARFLKSKAWRSSPLTPMRLMVAATLLQPVVSLMGSFFTNAQLGGAESGGALAFCSMPTSPAVRTVSRYLQLLGAPRSAFWLPLCGIQGWTRILKTQVFAAALLMVGHLWLRLVRRFETWPWLLVRLVCPDATAQERQEIATRLLEASDCCLDPGLARPLKHAVASQDELLSEEYLAFLTDAFAHCPVSNMPTEFRFARTRRHQSSCHSKALAAATVAAKHVLSEAQNVHRNAGRLGALEPHTGASLPTRKRQVNNVTGWNMFVAQRRHTTASLTELGRQWRALSEDDRQQFNAQVPIARRFQHVTCSALRQSAPHACHDASHATLLEPISQRALLGPAPAAALQPIGAASGGVLADFVQGGGGAAHGGELVAHATPEPKASLPLWGLADAAYPVSVPALQDCASEIRTRAAQWEAEHAELIRPTSELLTAKCRTCYDDFGLVCKRSMASVARALFRDYRGIVHGLALLVARRPAAHEVLVLPPMFHISNGVGDGLAVLLLVSMESPIQHVFMECAVQGPLVPGAYVWAILEMSALLEGKDLAHRMVQMGGHLEVKRVMYEFSDEASFERLQVVSTEDCWATARAAHEEQAARRGRAVPPGDGDHDCEPANADVGVVLQAFGPQPKAARRPRRGPRGPQERAAQRGPAAPDRAGVEPDASSSSDDSVPGAAEAAEAAGNPFLPDELGADEHLERLVPQEEQEEWAAAVEQAEEHALQAAMPVYDPATSQVSMPDNPGVSIGRIKIMHPGTDSEKLTVYCRMHGCSKILPASRAPSFDGVCRWFGWGAANLPRGVAHKAAHLAAWGQETK